MRINCFNIGIQGKICKEVIPRICKCVMCIPTIPLMVNNLKGVIQCFLSFWWVSILTTV